MLMARALACWAVVVCPCRAMLYVPQTGVSLYDTWLFKDGESWVGYFLAKPANASTGPLAPGWDRVEMITSSDGAHFVDAGVAVTKTCVSADDCAVWLGSGSTWRANGTYVINFSMNKYACEGDPEGGPTGDPDWCQSIFFATAPTPLGPWTEVAPDAERNGGDVFKYGPGYLVGGGVERRDSFLNTRFETLRNPCRPW